MSVRVVMRDSMRTRPSADSSPRGRFTCTFDVQMARAIESSVANLEVFVRTYELGNFTRAAAALGPTPQAASRALGRLEDHLGATLFRRTTRNLEPTDAGRLYYAHCRQALDLLARGERELSRNGGDEAGTV